MFGGQDKDSKLGKGVLSLEELCRKAIIRRITTVYSVENTPNHLLKEILDKIPNHRQLRDIEKNSPHVTEITKSQWIRLIKRDFPNADIDAYIPQDDTKWYKCYAKHASEHSRKEQEMVDKLRGQYNALNDNKEKHQTKLLDKTPYMPRAYRMGGAGLRRPGDPWVRENWSSAAGSRTKNLLTKIKRQMAEKRIFTQPKFTRAGPAISRDLKEKLVSSIPEDNRRDAPPSKRTEPPTASFSGSSNRPSMAAVSAALGSAGIKDCRPKPPTPYSENRNLTGRNHLQTSPLPAPRQPQSASGNGSGLQRKSEASCFMPNSKRPKFGHPK